MPSRHRDIDFAVGLAAFDERTRHVLHEGIEDLVHLLLGVVVGGRVGDDRGVGLERDERLVALVDFGDGVLSLAETDRPFPARDIRAVDAHRVESAFGEDVSEHRGHRRLAAGADDRDELVAAERPGEGLGAMGDGDAEFLRLDEARVRLLDRRGDDDLVRRRIDAAAVIGEAFDAQRLEKRDVLRTEGAVRARDLVTELEERCRKCTHADATDSDQMSFHVRPHRLPPATVSAMFR